jgi:hypothetical protein
MLNWLAFLDVASAEEHNALDNLYFVSAIKPNGVSAEHHNSPFDRHDEHY